MYQLLLTQYQSLPRQALGWQVALALDNFVASGPEGLQLALMFQELIESCSFVTSELEERQ